MSAPTTPTPTLPEAPTNLPAPAEVPPVDATPGLAAAVDESNALVQGLKTLWAKIKSGAFGNRVVLVVIVGAILIGVAWWYLAKVTREAQSKLWLNYESAVGTIGMQTFLDSPDMSKTDAAKLVRLNMVRDKADTAVRKLTYPLQIDRKQGASDAAVSRDELLKLADEFGKDRTVKASALLAAAKVEFALIGIRAESASPLEFNLNPKSGSIGTVEKYAELLKKVSDAVGTTTELGKKYAEQAERAVKDEGETYKIGRELYARFYDADFEPKPNKPIIPAIPGK